MKISIKDITGKDQGELEIKFELVENGRGTQAVHDAVVAIRKKDAKKNAADAKKAEAKTDAKK